MAGRGLDDDGAIASEGSLERVSETFAPVVACAQTRLQELFDASRLRSIYLYGSIPRGTASRGVSDLDMLVVLDDEPTDVDRTAIRAVEAALDEAFPQIDGAGLQLSNAGELLSELERYDGGFSSPACAR
jgi:uncharacterized protein